MTLEEMVETKEEEGVFPACAVCANRAPRSCGGLSTAGGVGTVEAC